MVKHGTIWQDNNIRLIAIFVAQNQKFLCLNAKRFTLGFSHSKNTYVSLSIKAKPKKKRFVNIVLNVVRMAFCDKLNELLTSIKLFSFSSIVSGEFIILLTIILENY